MFLTRIASAIGSPIFPFVPECSYCAAMRFALLSSLVTGEIMGFIYYHLIAGIFVGFWVGTFIVASIYIDYKRKYGNESVGSEEE